MIILAGPARAAMAAGASASLAADFDSFSHDEQLSFLLGRLSKAEPRLEIAAGDPVTVEYPSADDGGSHVEYVFELQCGPLDSLLFFATRFSAAKEQHRRWSEAGLLRTSPTPSTAASAAAGGGKGGSGGRAAATGIQFPKLSIIDSLFRDFTSNGVNVQRRRQELEVRAGSLA
eukprot:SAG22_NODE_2694_length_2306_cov_1.346171_2_plen_174_part_00